MLVRDAKTPVEIVRKKIDQGYTKLKELTHKVKDRFIRKEEEPNRFVRYFEEIKGGADGKEEPPEVIITTPRTISNKVHVSRTPAPSFMEPSEGPVMKRTQSATAVPQ